MKSKWIKCPSVTTGGKPHFWHRRFSDGRRVNVAWDRSAKCWRMYYGANYELASGEMFDLARDAMRFAEALANLELRMAHIQSLTYDQFTHERK